MPASLYDQERALYARASNTELRAVPAQLEQFTARSNAPMRCAGYPGGKARPVNAARHSGRGRLSQRQIRAIAYGLADEIETRAQALRLADPRLSQAQAINRALAQMAGV